MELRQLQYVVAAVEEGSFTRAAERVHVAQPAISQQIAQLERELGDRLFDRSERRIRLTPAGEAFLSHAREALRATGAARDAVLALRGELAGVLTIGTIPFPPEWLTERLGRFRREHPAVRLRLRSGDPEELADGVAGGSLDAALIGLAGRRLPAGPAGQPLRASLASATVATEPLVIAVPRDHRLASSAEVRLSALRDLDVVTLLPGTGLRAVLESACSEAGFAPRVQAETDDLSALADLVAHGLGVALLPRSVAERAQPGLAILPVRRPALRRWMVMIWHRQQVSVPGQAFLSLAGVLPEA